MAHSPLTVLGEHHEGMVWQMIGRTALGNAVPGVICADGRLGYAQSGRSVLGVRG